MRADNISLLAKKDPLICAYTSRYLKIHRENNSIIVGSRKMRELAKLLIEVIKIKSTVIDVFGALNSKNYDILVSDTKTMAKYDTKSNL